jgi:putative ATP-binding cassette transporter
MQQDTEGVSMDDQPAKTPASPGLDAPPVGHDLLTQSLMMFRAFMASPERNKLLLLGGGLIVVIGATAFGQIRLNAWNQPFYDALARKDLVAFGEQIIVFAVIAGALLALNVGQMWLNRMAKVKLREGLVRDLFDEWLEPRRAFRLASAGEMGVNPDQRIHEDARQLTELSTDLGVGLLQSSLLLGSFIGVLWILSDSVTFDMDGRSFVIPGYLVWSALAYAGAASWLSWRVGRPLIPLNAERYAREAELRFSLVRVSEHVDAITLQGGEADEKHRLNAELDRVLDVMRRIVGATTRLTWVTAGYGWFTIIAPILVASPGFFGGDLSFGGLMMAVGAFIQVQQALRWFIDNFGTIADWRATLQRVASFREAVMAVETLDKAASRIEFAEDSEGKFRFENLEIATPTGCTMLKEKQVEIAPGDRVLIVGEPGMGKTILFRAIAGLWPWGAGRIARPADEKTAFISRRPYVPPGTLRAALAYPAADAAYADSDLVAALESVRLGHLASALDRVARWDRELSEEEQQRLSFARLRLQQPRWIVIDEALDALDDHARKVVLDLLRTDLADAAVINIGRPEKGDDLFTRTLHLVKDLHGRSFKRRSAPEPRLRVLASAPALSLQPTP